MDVTKENFDAVFGVFKEALRESDFISFDTEMSGVQSQISQRHRMLDTIQEYYNKIRDSVKNFAVLQFGVCTFKWDAESESFIARPFNFNIYPSSFGGTDRTFLCQPASLTFLINNNFDFNKWINQGIPYLSRTDEERLRKTITVKPKFTPTRGSLNEVEINSEGDKSFVADVLKKVEDWLQNSTEPKYLVGPCNSYQRRLVYQEVPKRFPQISTDSTGGAHVAILRMTFEEKAKQDVDPALKSDQDINYAVGFRKVFDLMKDYTKPVCGHNLFLDMGHMLDKFDGPIPENSDDFKKRTRELFPVVFDTKYLAVKAFKEQGTALGDLYRVVNHAPYGVPEIDFSSYQDEASLHEAAYDAYLTENNSEGVDFAHSVQSLKPFVNKYFMMSSDMCFNVTGDDEIPDRSNTFYVFGFSKEIKTNDLIVYYKSFVSRETRIRVEWVDQQSAFIIFDKCDPSISEKITVDETRFKAVTYNDYLELMKNAQKTEKNSETVEEVRQPRKRALSEEKKPRRFSSYARSLLPATTVTVVEDAKEPTRKKPKSDKSQNFPETCTIL